MQILGYTIYATQQEGGIKGDGRVGISFQSSDYTVSDLHAIIDKLNGIAKVMASGKGERNGILDRE